LVGFGVFGVCVLSFCTCSFNRYGKLGSQRYELAQGALAALQIDRELDLLAVARSLAVELARP
jgi:hypothetical protein